MSGGPTQQPGAFHDMSYVGPGPAQYASKALDINNQDAMGPYYRANTYNHHMTDPRQPGQATTSYPVTSSSNVENIPAIYHTVGTVGDTYEAARRPSMHQPIQQGVSLYPSPVQHTRLAPCPPAQQQHLLYAKQEPEAGTSLQYQPAANSWSAHHQMM